MSVLVVRNPGSNSEILCVILCNDSRHKKRARKLVAEYFATQPTPDADLWTWLKQRGFKCPMYDEMWPEEETS